MHTKQPHIKQQNIKKYVTHHKNSQKNQRKIPSNTILKQKRTNIFQLKKRTTSLNAP
tara:strand:- start:651 stop:821 length:171 start_codon:yes stop_codon:yes gene_type:complete